MTPAAGTRAIARGHLYLVDGCLAVGVFGLALITVVLGRHRGENASGVLILLGAATCAPLIARRRWPVMVAGLVVAAAVVSVSVDRGLTPVVLAVVVAVYTVGATTDRGTTVAVAATTTLVLAMASAWADGGLWPEPRTVATVAWTLMAAAVGDAVRSRRAYVASVEERARRAEQTREEEARRRVAEERLRIARELHDAVAHHIAVANVQAGVASHLLTTQPPAAEEALGHIRRATRTVLEELAAMLSVLREPGDPTGPTEPTPGLAQVEELVGSFAASGLQISYSVTGRPQHPVPPTVDLVAYRIVQEALTNAHKHGSGQAQVTVAHHQTSLTIEVTNRRAAVGVAEADRSGHGLVGMRERATAVGGSFHAGPEPNGRYRVVVNLPTKEADDL